jgi:hypothetical protein
MNIVKPEVVDGFVAHNKFHRCPNMAESYLLDDVAHTGNFGNLPEPKERWFEIVADEARSERLVPVAAQVFGLAVLAIFTARFD